MGRVHVLCTCVEGSNFFPSSSPHFYPILISPSIVWNTQTPTTQPRCPTLYFPFNLKCTLPIGLDTRPQPVREGGRFLPPSFFTYTAAAAGESITRASFLHNIGTIGRPARGMGEERWKLVMVALAPMGGREGGRLALTIINGRRLAIEKGVSDKMGAAVEEGSWQL